MRIALKSVYILVFAFGILSFVIMVGAGPTRENLIRGEWQELTWEYEKVGKSENDSLYRHIPEDVKNEIGENLIIHKAETWTFLPHGKLRLKGSESEKTVNWTIKGRGNILVLKYGDGLTEHYVLTELDDTKMCLNFEAGIQARGIAKLTFERIKN